MEALSSTEYEMREEQDAKDRIAAEAQEAASKRKREYVFAETIYKVGHNNNLRLGVITST